MQTGYYPVRHSRIHYRRWGVGNRPIFAFHGYGESAASFAFLGEALGDEYTLVAIDLPFHGQTDWNEGLSFDPPQLRSVLHELAATLDLPLSGWILLGYSMGGRIALQLLEDDPASVDKLLLLAPDGLTVNSWYWLATQTGPGNILFRRTMRRPGWLFLVLRAGNALGLVNRSVYKFTIQYINDEAVRDRLYTRWTTMRKFRPDLPAIAAIIRTRQLPVSLFFGRYDRIIRWERGEKFRKMVNAATCTLTLLPNGHQILRVENLGALLAALDSPRPD